MDRNERAARVANTLLDVVAAHTRTAAEAVGALAFALAHVCEAGSVPEEQAVLRVKQAHANLLHARRLQQAAEKEG
jgi:hypothetical protein